MIEFDISEDSYRMLLNEAATSERTVEEVVEYMIARYLKGCEKNG